MTNWKIYTLVAVVATATGFGYIRSTHRNIPADLRDAVADDGQFDASHPVFDKNSGNIPEPKAEVVGVFDKGYVAATDPAAGVPTKPVEWVTITGGKFTMGTDSDEKGFENAKPSHEVAIETFDPIIPAS